MSAEYNTNITGGGVRKICMPLLFFMEKVIQEIVMKLSRPDKKTDKMQPGSIWRMKDFYDRMKQGKYGQTGRRIPIKVLL